jgi:hypothetical protein
MLVALRHSESTSRGRHACRILTRETPIARALARDGLVEIWAEEGLLHAEVRVQGPLQAARSRLRPVWRTGPQRPHLREPRTRECGLMLPKVPRREGATAVKQSTRARRRKARQFADQADLCRQAGCVACTAVLSLCTTRDEHMSEAKRLYAEGCRPLHAEPHHEPSRGAGGTDRDTVGLCHVHHMERHRVGPEFWGRYGLDVEQIKARLRAQVEASSAQNR